jgi:hypothetical protein
MHALPCPGTISAPVSFTLSGQVSLVDQAADLPKSPWRLDFTLFGIIESYAWKEEVDDDAGTLHLEKTLATWSIPTATRLPLAWSQSISLPPSTPPSFRERMGRIEYYLEVVMSSPAKQQRPLARGRVPIKVSFAPVRTPVTTPHVPPIVAPSPGKGESRKAQCTLHIVNPRLHKGQELEVRLDVEALPRRPAAARLDRISFSLHSYTDHILAGDGPPEIRRNWRSQPLDRWVACIYWPYFSPPVHN